MFDIGSGELLLILIAVLVFFGPRKLPELAQSLGRGLREFKKAQREFTDHINDAMNDESQKSRNTVARRSSYSPPPVSSSPSDVSEFNDPMRESAVLFPSAENLPRYTEPVNQMAIDYSEASALSETSEPSEISALSETSEPSEVAEAADAPEVSGIAEAPAVSNASEPSDIPEEPQGTAAIADSPKKRTSTTRRARDNREI